MVKAVEHKEVVSFSVIFDWRNANTGFYFDKLACWLDELNYSEFTFVLWEEIEDDILNNSTRVDKLKQYGKIIPRRDYLQQLAPSERKTQIDNMISKYTSKLGLTPKGMMSFIPDTYTVQYLLQKNFTYVQGYCFDQYIIDYMSMRGGFQMPYYANPNHALIPSNQMQGIVILPHSTWDWIESFRITHNMHLHPMNLIKLFNSDVTKAKNYFLSLIDYALNGSEPFGLAICQFEWEWCVDWGYDEHAKDWINTTINTRTYEFWDLETIAEWFKANYQFTPTYHIAFTSPYSNEQIEWSYDLNSRIARIGNKVVSYVDYAKQASDKFLTEAKRVNWAVPSSSSNCIDNSLEFKIDALGGGELRAPIKTDMYHYSGSLSDFPSHFYSNQNTPPQTVLVEYLAVLGLLVLICVGFIIKWKK